MEFHTSEKIDKAITEIDAFWEYICPSWPDNIKHYPEFLWVTTYSDSDHSDDCIELGKIYGEKLAKLRQESPESPDLKVFKIYRIRDEAIYYMIGFSEDDILTKIEKMVEDSE